MGYKQYVRKRQELENLLYEDGINVFEIFPDSGPEFLSYPFETHFSINPKEEEKFYERQAEINDLIDNFSKNLNHPLIKDFCRFIGYKKVTKRKIKQYRYIFLNYTMSLEFEAYSFEEMLRLTVRHIIQDTKYQEFPIILLFQVIESIFFDQIQEEFDTTIYEDNDQIRKSERVPIYEVILTILSMLFASVIYYSQTYIEKHYSHNKWYKWARKYDREMNLVRYYVIFWILKKRTYPASMLILEIHSWNKLCFLLLNLKTISFK